MFNKLEYSRMKEFRATSMPELMEVINEYCKSRPYLKIADVHYIKDGARAVVAYVAFYC